MQDLAAMMKELQELQKADPALFGQMLTAAKSMGGAKQPQNNAVRNQSSLSEDSEKLRRQLIDNVGHMKNLYETTQSRKGQKPVLTPGNGLQMQFRMQREGGKLRKSLNPDNHIALNSSIFDVYHSKVTDLSTLRSITIDQLRLETCHQGRYILLRTLEEPDRMNAIQTIVEDCNGQQILLGIYNYSRYLTEDPSLYLPVNSILLIKEPYFKSTSNNGIMIRCDSPTDIVFVNFKDANYDRFKIASIRDWGSVSASNDCVHAAPCPKTLVDWKTRGNLLYQKGFYKDAVRAYSCGLSMNVDAESAEDEECRLFLLLNRSAAYLAMRRFDDAAKDAESVLNCRPDNPKALFRAAQSFYQLRRFELALPYYEHLARSDASYEKSLEACRQRIKEQHHGAYDWKDLHAQTASTEAVRLDVADYFNSEVIERRFISKNKGQGIIAKQNILPGTLLAVCKAFAIAFKEEIKGFTIMEFHFKSNSMSSTTQVQSVLHAIHNILECPSRAHELNQLWSGKGDEADRKEEADNGIIDFEHVFYISKYNSFSNGSAFGKEVQMSPYHPSNGPIEKETSTTRNEALMKSGSGLWITSSFFNHACIPNAVYHFVGDVMIIKTTKMILAGEEVTLPYICHDLDLKERREALSKYGFTCHCELCTMQSSSNKRTFEKLFQKYEKDISPRVRRLDVRVMPILEKFISDVKKAYAQHGQTEFLFKMPDIMGGLALLYQHTGRFKEATATYEQAFVYYTQIRDVNAFLKGEDTKGVALSHPVAQMLALHVVEGYRRLKNKKKESEWMDMLTFFVRLSGKGDEEVKKMLSTLH